MVVPYAEVGYTGGVGSQDFDFYQVDIDVLVKHTYGAVKETVEYLSLEFRGMLRTGNINLGVINVGMLLRTLGIDGTNQSEKVG